MKAPKSITWLVLLWLCACGEQARQAEAPESPMLLFDDPGPRPASVDKLFEGTNWNVPADAPNGGITASLLACGAKELKIANADMDHTWSVAVRKPSPERPFLTCVARHAGPMQFRVREIEVANVR
jgi:hypothetical protein